jgi:hypothetical protein
VDGRQFDRLAIALANERSRRSLLGLVLGGGAGTLSRLLMASQVKAATCTVDTECEHCESCFRGTCRPLFCPSSTCYTVGCDPVIPHQCGDAETWNDGQPCNEGRVCSNGYCCLVGTIGCSAEDCVDLQTDESHCGACDNACAGDQECCSGECRNTQSDESHCGGCGVACDDDQLCESGQCVSAPPPCPPGQKLCDGRCVKTAIDRRNCGKCGRVCDGKKRCCAGQCRNLETDERHCGRCGRRCKNGERCRRGRCRK